MKIKFSELLNDIYFFSGKSSDVSRQFSLGGLALIWLFKNNITDAQKNLGISISFPYELKWAGFFIITSLFFDLIQYFYAHWCWRSFYLKEEEKGRLADEMVELDKKIENNIFVIYCIKHVFLLAAYMFIFHFLYDAVGLREKFENFFLPLQDGGLFNQ